VITCELGKNRLKLLEGLVVVDNYGEKITEKITILDEFINSSSEYAIKQAAESIVEELQSIIDLVEHIEDTDVSQHFISKITMIFAEIEGCLVDKITPNYCCAVAIAKDEALYLAEWIEYHRLVGIDKFIIYDNDSTDNTADVLAPYVTMGIVEHILWQGVGQQNLAYLDALRRLRYESEWLAFIDIDEFIVPLSSETIVEFLRELSDDVGQVLIDWRSFNSSGHITKPEGLVIENYTMRSERNNCFKAIVRPSYALLDLIGARCPHWFDGIEGRTVNEEGIEIVGDLFTYIEGEGRLQHKMAVYHYLVKSKEEFFIRRSRAKADTGSTFCEERKITLEQLFIEADCYNYEKCFGKNKNDRYDIYDDYMFKYVDRVKEALTQTREFDQRR